MRTILVLLVVSFLLGGCDQSVNNPSMAETELTGMYCDAKGDQEGNCQAGDVVVTVKGRERTLCDWGRQIVHEPGSDDILCVHRGPLRIVRPPAPSANEAVESVK